MGWSGPSFRLCAATWRDVLADFDGLYTFVVGNVTGLVCFLLLSGQHFISHPSNYGYFT